MDTDELLSEDKNQQCDNIYRARRKLLPPLPRNINEVHNYLETTLIKTNKKEEHFLLTNNKTDHIIVISTIENLQFLCSLETIYVDGTFE